MMEDPEEKAEQVEEKSEEHSEEGTHMTENPEEKEEQVEEKSEEDDSEEESTASSEEEAMQVFEDTEAEEGVQEILKGSPIDAKDLHKAAWHHGNFKNYYERRYQGLENEDPRFKFMRKEWFVGKECLDIGCNSGIFTIKIAREFRCKTMLGIDVDADLIEEANSNLREAAALKAAADSAIAKEKVEYAQQFFYSPVEYVPPPFDRNLLEVVSFRKENFIENEQPHEELYDTILCLSVTQWIHLNYLDEGIITLFARIWELLRPGGVLVLEPQSWKSYVNKNTISVVTEINYNQIKLRPWDFQKILLDRIGFKTVEHVNLSCLHTKARFNRPILVFTK